MQYAFLRGEAILVLTLDQTLTFFINFTTWCRFTKVYIYLKKKKEIPGAKIKNIGKLQYM